MEDNRKNTGNDKVINVDFQSESKIKIEKPSHNLNSQTNPILKRLFKLTHTEISNYNSEYKSFSKFKPEDLR